MIIGSCVIHLYLPGAVSLKDKRHRIKPLLHKLRRRFEVAAAEVDKQDVWQSADIAIVTVTNDIGLAHSLLEKAVHWIEEDYYDAQVLDWQIEVW